MEYIGELKTKEDLEMGEVDKCKVGVGWDAALAKFVLTLVEKKGMQVERNVVWLYWAASP